MNGRNSKEEIFMEKIGLIGYGNIGRKLVEILTPFNPSLLIYDMCEIDPDNNSYARQCNLETLLSSSDIISLYVPHKETKTILLRKMNLIKCKMIVY